MDEVKEQNPSSLAEALKEKYQGQEKTSSHSEESEQKWVDAFSKYSGRKE
ncbi:hypothetical protein SAMN05216351_105128 [Pseudobutyrivibrio sp. JW11]|nr:hypothetical protein [Pseudobutyrivibrio sp. JW11]SFO27108.1 hypothetical protein SAMN05216351_105128 [Pseudobutyrivibrio sp. JW11]